MEKESSLPPTAEESAVPGNQTGASNPPAFVVGIGVAEGALKSLREILAGLPAGQGLAVVLVYHPQFTNNIDLLTLLKKTVLKVVAAANDMPVRADHIYVMPANQFLSIAADRLTFREPVHCNGLLMPIDHFFCSLAEDRRNSCCGILLSSAGSDGMLGLSEIRAAGGWTIVEDMGRASLSDRPQDTHDALAADAVLSAGSIAAAVTELAGEVVARRGRAESKEPGLEAILNILCARAGHDFHSYKPGTLVRRIRRRMTLIGIPTMDAYVQHLTDDPSEAGLLQKDLLIGVTEFFRQPLAWETLERKVIVPLVENAVPGSVIRVWIPGCSSGKEVYSLAMLLAEQVKVSTGKIDFQIFATDVDDAALATARAGSYTAEEIGPNVSPERLKRFFSRSCRDNRCQVVKTLRGRIIFAAQNLTADPPLSRLDLVVCRNLLIYLDQPMQRRIITLFHFSLREQGFLFLGNAETIDSREDLFEPVVKKWRIYRRIGVGRRVSEEFQILPAGPPCTAAKSPAAGTSRTSLASMAQQVLLDRFAPACVIIDRKRQVLYTHGTIENYLTLPAGEWTTQVTDMVREGLRARLRGTIGKCIESGRTASFTARTRRGEKSIPVKTSVIPLRHLRGSDGLLLVTFEDQCFPTPKSGEPAADHGSIREMADELKIIREELQSTIDQLEGSNDQLKASNEEVIAANEELQASNEEMETSKEELQALNEELNTINLRLQEKVAELESVNNDMVNLLASTSIATVFLDKALRIKRYTPAATQLMSLIPSDQGRSFGDILMHFNDETLLEDARRVLVDLNPLAQEVRAVDGRWHIRRIMPYRTQDDRIEGVVITFVDITDLKKAEQVLRSALESTAWLARFPGENPNPVARASAKGTILYCNPASEKNGDWACRAGEPLPVPLLPHVAEAMAKGEALYREIQMGEDFYAVTLMPFPAEAYLNIYGRSITMRKRAEETLRRSEERLKRAQEIAHLGSWELTPADGGLFWSDEVYRIFGLEPQKFAATYEAFLEAVHPDDRKAVDDAYSESIRENRDAYEIEHRVIRRQTGEIRFVQERCQHIRDSAGKIIRSVGMVHDITERRRVDEALRQLNAELEERVAQQTTELREANEMLEQRVAERTAELEATRAEAEKGKRLLESVMVALPVGVAITDGEGGNIRSNRAYDELWGKPRPAAQSIEDYASYQAWWPETGEPVQPEEWASAQAVRQGKTVVGQLLEIQRFNGDRAFVLNSASPVTDAGGKIIGSAVAIQDITALKRTEEALRESESRVRLKLNSILSPAGDIGNLELADIIDVPIIQSLMTDFYNLALIPMAIIDLKGKVIVGAGWQEICTKFHRVHPKACRNCLESDTELTSGVLPGESKLYKCKNHLWDVATPIFVGGKHIGNVFSGQFFFDDERLDYSLFRCQAERYGFPETEYIAALEMVPRLNRQRVETAMAFFRKFSDLISRLSYANIQLARSVAEHDALTASLIASEERLKLFIEHAPAALAMFDRRMRYLSVSRRWRSDYNLGDEDLTGISHYEVIPETSEAWKEAHRRGLAGEVLGAAADRFVRADGSVQWVRWEIRPWYDEAGMVGGIVLFSEDITELMQANEALEHRSEQLAVANRELESFSYSVSHDLQAPLRAIDGYSRMILKKHAECFSEEALAKFNVIRDNTQMMGRLIDDLLAFSRLGKAHLSCTQLVMDPLIREVWEELLAANPDRRLTLTVGELPTAVGDRGLMRQVLFNLLSNAVKFSREQPEALIVVGGYAKEGECIYTVQDNGVGFDMQYHDKMFGVFQRLHSNEEFEGTGVGLAIVQRIIQRHGGRVWAEGTVGQGACLYFSLPCACAAE